MLLLPLWWKNTTRPLCFKRGPCIRPGTPVRAPYFCYEVYGELSVVHRLGDAGSFFFFFLSLLVSNIYYVPLWWELGMVVTVDISTVAASPNGGGNKVGVVGSWLGNLVNPQRLRTSEAEVILWLLLTFSQYCRAPGIPCILPWKDGLLLPGNSGLCRSCLFIYCLKFTTPPTT